jgi:two-component system, sensor histidine kinase
MPTPTPRPTSMAAASPQTQTTSSAGPGSASGSVNPPAPAPSLGSVTGPAVAGLAELLGAAPSPAAEAQARSSLPEEVRSAFDYMPATLAGNLAGIGVLMLLYWQRAPALAMAGWVGALALLWIGRLVLHRRFRHAAPVDLADWARWRWGWNTGTLCSGVLWGLSVWLFFPHGDNTQQTALIIVVYTLCIAAVPVMSTQPRVYLLFAAFCFVPMVVRITLVGDVYSLELAGILLLIFSLTLVLARSYRQALQRAIALKLQADELLDQLRIEKQAADEARHAAEVANRAKTQFFTAASHDLRQPLHAMGLFAEALRQKNHDEEVAHLVNSINGSVDALESLFSELLDITRIDTGGVAVNPQSFEVGDILRKLRLHFEPTAFEKGLMLRLRGGKHVVHADPLLVERILRNLVSNAIRYTLDGTVLVAARRRGDRVLLQVWDTGLGIPAEEQSRIFEEFYQIEAGTLPNGSSTAQAQQRKGLGLGLAIVKRLADLMQAPLELRSVHGRGSVFCLSLPVGKLVRGPAALPTVQAAVKVTLSERLIVVVEDEPAVRSGLEVLLKGWGATLASFESYAEATAWAAARGPADRLPDLLIVDYRLEKGRNGVDAILALRAQFGVPRLPAIVVTGSTMTGHDQEAQDKDFHLLIKPVVPNKLRAMIAFKLGVKAG